MKKDLSGLKSLESGFVIVGSILLLGMSYGLITPSILLIILITIGGLITSTIYLNNMDKEVFASYVDKEVGMVERFKKVGPIIGPIRLFLSLSVTITFITFNLFAWQLYIVSYLYLTLVIMARARKLGVELK